MRPRTLRLMSAGQSTAYKSARQESVLDEMPPCLPCCAPKVTLKMSTRHCLNEPMCAHVLVVDKSKGDRASHNCQAVDWCPAVSIPTHCLP